MSVQIETETNVFLHQHVPIPVTMYRCERGCCTRTFIPLEVSYARTIHKFQGLTAGPVDPGKIENMYQCIICDPDEKRFEGTSSIGLLYTAISRATTLGDEDGLNSAIYFDGKHFKEERIRRLTKYKNSDKDFLAAQKRQRWVDFLNRREEKSKTNFNDIQNRKKSIVDHMLNVTYDFEFLHQRIKKYSRCS